MLRLRRVLLVLHDFPSSAKGLSSEATETYFRRDLSRAIYHPDYHPASVSASILAEQRGLQKVDDAETSVLSRPGAKTDPRHIATKDNQYLRLAEIITPLWKVPYKKQLNTKWLKSVEFLRALKKKLWKRSVELRANQYGLPCDLESSLPSPKWRGYRNTDEFLVHVGVDTYTPTVGFCLGEPKKLDKTICVGPGFLTNVKPLHKEAAQLFQEYVQSSALPVVQDLSKSHWRKLLVRSNKNGELMLSVTMHPHNLPQSDVDKEKKKFVEFFTEGPGSELDLRSLYFQTWKDDGIPPLELLWGEPHLEETQGNLKLRFCPNTRLMENSYVADIFFQAISDAAELKPESTLLDVNCGAGGLSFHLAPQTTRVIGVKRTAGKISDVYYNAETNGISNVNFTQRALPSVLKQLRKHNFSHLVAVINPSEHMLMRESVILLKSIKSLNRIVYVADELDGRALKNILLLCQTCGRNFDGPQFFPVKAVPVDIYPQTNSYYFVIVFDRFS